MSDFHEIERMTLYEYNMRMKAFRLKQVDKEYDIHLQAWENWNVQAMKKQGKNKKVPVFKNFKEFFDYEARQQEAAEGKKDDKNRTISRVAAAMRRQKERRQGDGEL